ncbi:hypothetical protein Q5P01_005608 [Channa striata]|uniref:Protein sprouty homolog 2 n=1 Tax=Channa striata TaxID=64152 RepID=A0AA88NCX5_CHASR|nr:hypothetical protein Q5P01_005608 [Channa striata]
MPEHEEHGQWCSVCPGAGVWKARTSDVSHASQSGPSVPRWIPEVKTIAMGEEDTMGGQQHQLALWGHRMAKGDHSHGLCKHTMGCQMLGEAVQWSSSLEDTQSSIRTSVGSSSSGQRLLSGSVGGGQIIRAQPKHGEHSSEELKPLSDEHRAVVAVPGSREYKNLGKHSKKCERCGRCQCRECRRPRVLPSCWMCNQRCMCSLQSAVEYGTCVCCIKGLFYHCSSDDEDTCADKPFSCTQSHCCVRWTTVSLLSLLFPCLLCYLPAKGCVTVCQSCYDRATRPGCRCKNTNPIHCEDVGKPT